MIEAVLVHSRNSLKHRSGADIHRSLTSFGMTKVEIGRELDTLTIRLLFALVYGAVTMPSLIEYKNFWDHTHVSVKQC